MKRIFSYLLPVFLLLFLAIQMQAQTTTLSIQGVLKKTDGTAVDNGSYDLTFKLYTTITGGSAVWTENQSGIKVQGGIYSAKLGAVTTLPGFNQNYYLGVTIAGEELTPRTQLTAAPYALSLLGTSNIFPSSGNVGIGTTSPSYPLHVTGGDGYFNGNAFVNGRLGIGTTSPSYPLHVTGGDGYFNGNAFVNGRLGIGTTSPSYPLHVAGGAAYFDNNALVHGDLHVDGLGYFGGSISMPANSSVQAQNGFLALSSTTDGVHLQYAGLDKLYTSSSGVVIGNGFLNVDGFGIHAMQGYGYLNSSGQVGYDDNQQYAIEYSIIARNRIRASEFNASSDRRIKKDFQPADNRSDLDVLKKLEVTNYRHIDEVANGSALKKGFIAQQVEAFFPEAVSKTPGFIPNIYEKAASFEVSGERLTVVLAKNHELKTGDEVRLMLPEGKKELKVVAVADDKTFTIEGWTEKKTPEWVFAYGKKVEDFRQVDYDRIHTLNVSATQELARKVEALEKENARLKSENGSLKTSLEGVDARLKKLETALSN